MTDITQGASVALHTLALFTAVLALILIRISKSKK